MAGAMFASNREADACGIVGVVGAPNEKDDARGFLIEGLQVKDRSLLLFVHSELPPPCAYHYLTCH
jgi:hypothetical protein